MDAPFGSQRHPRRLAINITPLIDVMFLLLIFFMVSSTFRHDAGIDLTLPAAETGSAGTGEGHEIVVDATGGYLIDGSSVSVVELEERLRAIVTEAPAQSIVLRADARAAFQPVVTVLDLARKTGATQLIIPTSPTASLAAP